MPAHAYFIFWLSTGCWYQCFSLSRTFLISVPGDEQGSSTLLIDSLSLKHTFLQRFISRFLYTLILKLLQGVFNGLLKSLDLMLMPLYDLHKQTRRFREKINYFCIVILNVCHLECHEENVFTFSQPQVQCAGC